MDEKELREKAIQEAEKVDGEFDKERQRADQAEANFRKAQAEKQQMSTQMSQLQQQFEQQQRQLAELNAQSKASKSIAESLPDINIEDATIEDVAKVVAASKKIIADQAKELASLKTKANQYEQESAKERAEREARERRNQVLNDVCAELEEEFGSGLRNDAIKLMEQMNEEHGLPENPAKAVLRLRKCFKTVKDKKASNKETNPNRHLITDTGGGGERPAFGNPEVKKGSLEEVSAQYGKLGAGR